MLQRMQRAENWDALKLLLEDWVREQSVDELYHKAQARRIPFAPVSTMGDVLNSEHLKARGFFAEIAHPVAGTFPYPTAPYQFSAMQWTLRRHAPCLGQHNAEVFGELGVDAKGQNSCEQGLSRQKRRETEKGELQISSPLSAPRFSPAPILCFNSI